VGNRQIWIVLAFQRGLRFEDNLGQIAHLDLAWDHEDWPRSEQAVWVALQGPWVWFLIEGLHANCLEEALAEVLALLLRGALLSVHVGDPNLGPLNLKVVLGLQDRIELLVGVRQSVHFDRVKALSDTDDEGVVVAVRDVEEILTNADGATTFVVRDHLQHNATIVVIETNSTVLDRCE